MIDALPVLNRTDATFKTDVETFFGTDLPAFSVQAEAARVQINSNTTTTQQQADLAQAQVPLAQAQTLVATQQSQAAASSALSAGAIAWVSGTTYAIGNLRYSPLNSQVYRRLTTGAGTTDPSLDFTNWNIVNGITSENINVPSNNLPLVRPTLSLDFSNNQSVDPRITFTRASIATRINAKGLIEVVASGVPRIDFDPVTGACKGLLIEEQRANLLTYSEAFDNAAWAKNNATVTANATTAPDGQVTADKLVESTATSAHSVYQTGVSVTSGSTYTYAVFAKASERSKLEISFNSNNAAFADSQAVFDLLAGTSSSTNTISHGIRSMVNGWFLCWATEAATASAVCVIELRIFTSSNVYTGDGTSGLFIWGAQLEAGAFPTSYIPTVASQVTRAADVAIMTGANFSSWYRQDEGSFVVDAIGMPGSTMILTVSKGLGTYGGRIQYNSYAPTLNVINDSGSVDVAIASGTVVANGVQFKTAGAYKVNDAAISTNGSAISADSSCTLPTAMADLRIGSSSVGTNQGSVIKSITYYPKRLTNAELVALSTQ